MEKEPRKIFGLKKNVFFLGLVSLFNDFSNEMIQSIMPFFLSVTLGISKVEIGLIEGVANVGSSFLRIFSGWLSDKMGKRKLPAVMGYALSVLTRPFYLFISSFTQVFSLRVIDRIGKGFRDSPRDALLASSVSSNEVGKSFGYQRAMDAIGGLLGPFGAALTIFFFIGMVDYSNLSPSGFNPLFLTAFVVGILALLSFVFVREIKAPKEEMSLKLDLKMLKDNRNFLLFIISIFIFGLGTIPIVLMFVRTVELEFTLVAIPIVYFIYGGSKALTSVPLGRLSDKMGQRLIIASGFVLAVIASFILAFSESIYWSILAFVLMGLYAGATDGVERALASKLIGPKLLATGEGVLQAAIGVSSLLSAVIGGLLWDFFGHQEAFVYWGTMSAIGLILFIYISFSNSRHHHSNNDMKMYDNHV